MSVCDRFKNFKYYFSRAKISDKAFNINRNQRQEKSTYSNKICIWHHAS